MSLNYTFNVFFYLPTFMHGRTKGLRGDYARDGAVRECHHRCSFIIVCFKHEKICWRRTHWVIFMVPFTFAFLRLLFAKIFLFSFLFFILFDSIKRLSHKTYIKWWTSFCVLLLASSSSCAIKHHVQLRSASSLHFRMTHYESKDESIDEWELFMLENRKFSS